MAEPRTHEGGSDERLAWADGYVGTTSITIFRDELEKHGFDRFAASIDAFLGSTGAAYSALGYHEQAEEIADLRHALETIASIAQNWPGDDVARGRLLGEVVEIAQTTLERHS